MAFWYGALVASVLFFATMVLLWYRRNQQWEYERRLITHSQYELTGHIADFEYTDEQIAQLLEVDRYQANMRWEREHRPFLWKKVLNEGRPFDEVRSIYEHALGELGHPDYNGFIDYPGFFTDIQYQFLADLLPDSFSTDY